MIHPYRKTNRLANFDYRSCGAYFVTACTQNRRKLFRDSANCLTNIGQIVEEQILQIPIRYSGVRLDHYVVMHNHIHLLLIIENEQTASSVPTMINQMKGAVTKRIGRSVWQKLFHDRIVRNTAEYQKIWQYIDTNLLRWELDCFYCK